MAAEKNRPSARCGGKRQTLQWATSRIVSREMKTTVPGSNKEGKNVGSTRQGKMKQPRCLFATKKRGKNAFSPGRNTGTMEKMAFKKRPQKGIRVAEPRQKKARPYLSSLEFRGGTRRFSKPQVSPYYAFHTAGRKLARRSTISGAEGTS